MINRSSMSYLCQSVSPRPCNHCSECLMLLPARCSGHSAESR